MLVLADHVILGCRRTVALPSSASKQAGSAGATIHSVITMYFAFFACLLPHDVVPDTGCLSHLLLSYNVMSHFNMNEGKMLFLERIKSKSY